MSIYRNKIIQVNRSDASMLRIQSTVQLKIRLINLQLLNVYLLCLRDQKIRKKFSLTPNDTLLLTLPSPFSTLLLLKLQSRELAISIWEAGWGGSQVSHSRGGGSTGFLALKGKTQTNHQSTAREREESRKAVHKLRAQPAARQREAQAVLGNIRVAGDSR